MAGVFVTMDELWVNYNGLIEGTGHELLCTD